MLREKEKDEDAPLAFFGLFALSDLVLSLTSHQRITSSCPAFRETGEAPHQPSQEDSDTEAARGKEAVARAAEGAVTCRASPRVDGSLAVRGLSPR
jgi:hypothetical protein